jgi:hypothetical protein
MGSGAVVGGIGVVRFDACRLGLAVLGCAFSSWNEARRVLVGRGIFAIVRRRKAMVCSRSRCFSRSSHDQSLNVAHELTTSLSYAVVPSDNNRQRPGTKPVRAPSNPSCRWRVSDSGHYRLGRWRQGLFPDSRWQVGEPWRSGRYRSRDHDCRSRLRHCAAKEVTPGRTND